MTVRPPGPPDLRGRRSVAVVVVGTLLALGIFYGLLPQLPELRSTLRQFGDGSGWWLLAAFALEVASFTAYVIAFHAVFSGDHDGIDWRASLELTFAGVVASRLLAAGGAGGIALTAWGLRRFGMSTHDVRTRLTGFYMLLYAWFMVGLLVAGGGLALGVFPGPAPFGLTVVPALFAGGVIVAALLLGLVPPDLERRVPEAGPGGPRSLRWRRRLALVPATVSSGVRDAFALVRTRRPGLLGAPAWWVFDIAVLWACFHAFDAPPETAVLVAAYFTGQLGNLIPLPGGVGGVEGGMIGALLGFGVAAGPAVVAVLAYRAFAFWLPIVPGSIAYLHLVRHVRRWEAAARTEPQAAGSPKSRRAVPPT